MTECVYDLCSYICHTPCCTRTHFDTFHNFCFDVHLIAAKIGNLFALFLCQQNVQEHVEHNGNKTSAETDWKRPKKVCTILCQEVLSTIPCVLMWVNFQMCVRSVSNNGKGKK